MVRSWDAASDLPPFDVRPLMTAERDELLVLLRELGAREWRAGTACAGWSVHDIALHLLGNDFGRLRPLSQAGSRQFTTLGGARATFGALDRDGLSTDAVGAHHGACRPP